MNENSISLVDEYRAKVAELREKHEEENEQLRSYVMGLKAKFDAASSAVSAVSSAFGAAISALIFLALTATIAALVLALRFFKWRISGRIS